MARMICDNPPGPAASCACSEDRLRTLAESCPDWSLDRCVVVEDEMVKVVCWNCGEEFDVPESWYLGYGQGNVSNLCPNCDPSLQPKFPDVEATNPCFKLARPSKGKCALVIVTNRLTPEEIQVAMDVILERLGPYIGVTWQQDRPFIGDEADDESLKDAFDSFKGESLVDNLDENDFG